MVSPTPDPKDLTGTTLDNYEVLAKLGAGGMGDVWRARDTTLGREVAIKLLPDNFDESREHRARFEREARLLASLNHPGIATVFGLDEVDGTRFLAMELVGGGTLADLLDRGRIPMERVIELARQIATALEAAHAHGIVHRDIKPSNIGLTEHGRIKLLDFGLARVATPAVTGGDSGGASADAATIAATLTQPGTILGTPAYMSPEQVRGEKTDARSDLWSFGTVLYEMLTQRRAFDGTTLTDTLSLVLQREPDLDALPAQTPSAIRRLLRRCLVKDREMRLQSAGDARVILQECLDGDSEAMESASASGEPVTAMTRLRIPLLLILLPLVALAAWFAKPQAPVTEAQQGNFEISAPAGQRIYTRYKHGLALSPDGKILAFVGGSTDDPMSPETGESAIYLRHLDEWKSVKIPGTENASELSFSPDGEWLAFDQDHKLKRVRISGGEIEMIYDSHARSGIAWSKDGSIILGGFAGGLGRIRLAGGEVDTLALPNREAGEVQYILPHLLPDERTVLFTSRDLVTAIDYEKHARIKALRLDTGEQKILVRGASDARYLATGHLVYAKEGVLYAVAFDPERLEVLGEEVILIDGISHSIHAASFTRETGAAQFSVSDNGVLAYLPGSIFPERLRRVVWIDRDGIQESIDLEEKQYHGVKISPDGTLVLLSTNYPPSEVWCYELQRKTMRRQTFEGQNHLAIWGPGEDHFTVTANREGFTMVITKRLNAGPGNAEEIPNSKLLWAAQWDPRGEKLLAFTWAGDLWRLDAAGERESLLESNSYESSPMFSPDGNWLLYTSNESGQEDVYLRHWPGNATAQQVSVDGGMAPMWSPDGREIYFWYWGDEDELGSMMAVTVTHDSNRLELGAPVKLFEADPLFVTYHRNYDIGPDGRFLVVLAHTDSLNIAISEEMFPDRIRIVTDWFGEVRRKFGEN